jgi:hypothetical protein
MKTLLLVTWLIFGQSPSSYQVEFDTAEKCAQAKSAVLLDYERLYGPIVLATRPSALARAEINAGRPIYEKPKISALCVDG